MTEVVTPEQGLAAKSARGMVWTLGGLAVAEPIRIGFIAILARILSPEEFGLVSMAAVFLGLAAIVNDFGLSAALIQQAKLSEERAHVAFWLSLGIGVVAACAMGASSWTVAAVYGAPEVQPLVVGISVTLVISSLVQVQNAMVRRDMRFKWPAIANVAAVIISGMAGTVAALSGLGPWSLVIMNVVNALVSAAVIQCATRYVPRVLFLRSDAGALLSFGARVTGAELAGYSASTVDNLVVGTHVGAASLGLYGVAFNVVVYPVRRIASMVAMVTLPAFSRIQHDRERVMRAYERAIVQTSFVVLPLLAVAGVLAAELVAVLYGSQWAQAVVPLQVLCAAAAVRSVVVIDESVLRALGRPGLQMIWAVTMFIAVAVGALIAVPRGLTAIATGVSVSTVLTGLAGHRVLAGRLGISTARELRQLMPTLTLALVSGVVASACRLSFVSMGLPSTLVLIGSAIAGLAGPWVALRRLRVFSGMRDLERLVLGSLRKPTLS